MRQGDVQGLVSGSERLKGRRSRTMKRLLRRRWLIAALGLVVLALAVPLGARLYTRWQGRSRLAELIRKLDESDRPNRPR